MKYDIYTDGSFNNKKPELGASWAYVIGSKYETYIYKNSGLVDGDNNTGEIIAVGLALEYFIKSELFKNAESVTIHTDSTNVVKAICERWLNRWFKKGWKTSARKQLANKEHWEFLRTQLKILEASKIKVTVLDIKSHSGNKLNNICDQMAKYQIEQKSKLLSISD